MRALRLPVLLITVALASVSQAAAAPVSFGGMTADLPEGWNVVSDEVGGYAASSAGVAPGIGIFQATWLDPAAYPDARSLLAAVRASLGAQGEEAVYTVDGHPAALAEVTFRSGTQRMMGYLLAVDTPSADVALLAYADTGSYAVQVDFLLSALDSWRSAVATEDTPGPISQFLWPYPAAPTRVERVQFRGTTVPVRFSPEELDAMQALIEREARILVRYGDHPARDDAWRRYYRMIYRDSRPRLAGVAQAMDELAGNGRGSAEEASTILAWLQGFTYERTGSLSDLLSPLSSVISRTGDCDARSLALVLILSHLGTDGVILVSSVYSHAVAAVAVDAPGLGLMVDGRKYVLAETTKSVPLGWLSEDQRNLANWVVVRFDG